MLDTIPYDRMFKSADDRFLIDRSDRRTGKSTYLRQHVEEMIETMSLEMLWDIKIVNGPYGISPEWQGRFGRDIFIYNPSFIGNKPNTIYYIDEFDIVIRNENDFNKILLNTESYFYITGTPIPRNYSESLLNILCDYLSYKTIPVDTQYKEQNEYLTRLGIENG